MDTTPPTTFEAPYWNFLPRANVLLHELTDREYIYNLTNNVVNNPENKQLRIEINGPTKNMWFYEYDLNVQMDFHIYLDYNQYQQYELNPDHVTYTRYIANSPVSGATIKQSSQTSKLLVLQIILKSDNYLIEALSQSIQFSYSGWYQINPYWIWRNYLHIDALQTEVDALSNNILELTNIVNSNSSRITALETKTNALDSKVISLTDALGTTMVKVETLQESVGLLDNKLDVEVERLQEEIDNITPSGSLPYWIQKPPSSNPPFNQ